MKEHLAKDETAARKQ